MWVHDKIYWKVFIKMNFYSILIDFFLVDCVINLDLIQSEYVIRCYYNTLLNNAVFYKELRKRYLVMFQLIQIE